MAKSGSLQSTTVNNGGAGVVLGGTAAGANSLEGLDNVQGLLVSNLAENDVAAVEPRGDNGGDEELRAVAVKVVSIAVCAGIDDGRGTYVLAPALAMDNSPGLSCFSWKFSSANFSP